MVQRRWAWAAFAAFILAIPIAASLVARADKEHALPTLAQLPDFALVDQAQQPFSRTALDGSVWIADFIFTRCAEICPRLTAQMAKLTPLTTLKDGAPIRLLSITVDPERDTPEVLAAYAKSFGADTNSWRFVTGPSKSIEDAVVRGFKVAVERTAKAGSDDFDILHGMNFALVDRDGRLRGYYDALTPAEIKRLERDAQALARAGGR